MTEENIKEEELTKNNIEDEDDDKKVHDIVFVFDTRIHIYTYISDVFF